MNIKVNKQKNKALQGVASVIIAIVLGLFTRNSSAQTMQLACTYTGPDSSIALDYDHGYAVIAIGKNVMEIVKMDPMCGSVVVNRDTMPTIQLRDARIYAHNDTVVVLAQLDGGTIAKRIIPGQMSERYQSAGMDWWSICKGPRGLSYVQASDGMSMALIGEGIGMLPFTGAYMTPNLVSGQYRKNILSDQNYHYVLQLQPGGFMGIEVFDMTISPVTQYVFGVPTSVIGLQDAQQTDSTLIYVLQQNDSVIRYTINKVNGTYTVATLNRFTRMSIDDDGYKIVSDGVAMSENILLRHTKLPFGQQTVIDSVQFAQSFYYGFRSTTLPNNTIIWSAMSWDTSANSMMQSHVLVQAYSPILQRLDTLVINPVFQTFSNEIRRVDDSSFVVLGMMRDSAMINQLGKAGIWLVKMNPTNPMSINTTQKGGGDISIYPNPTSDMVTIASDDPLVSIDVVSMSGATLQHYSLEGVQKKTIDVRNIPSGIYYLRVQDSQHRVSIKKISKL
jgi:Secretion system C-terminal sorting domain